MRVGGIDMSGHSMDTLLSRVAVGIYVDCGNLKTGKGGTDFNMEGCSLIGLGGEISFKSQVVVLVAHDPQKPEALGTSHLLTTVRIWSLVWRLRRGLLVSTMTCQLRWE